MDWLKVALAAYLVGSVPTAIIIGKLWKGIDVRKHGSGNIGATNVFRILGAAPGLVVLLLDAFKGGLGVYAGVLWLGTDWGAVLGGIMAIAGHNWPIWLNFKGGRGVATGLGVMIMLAPLITLIVFGIFLALVFSTHYVSLGSIAAALLVPVLMLWFKEPLPFLVFGVVASALVIMRHRTNIGRLLKGTELKVSWGRNPSGDSKER